MQTIRVKAETGATRSHRNAVPDEATNQQDQTTMETTYLIYRNDENWTANQQDQTTMKTTYLIYRNDENWTAECLSRQEGCRFFASLKSAKEWVRTKNATTLRCKNCDS